MPTGNTLEGPSNLPRALSSFYGRSDEARRIEAWLEESRLLTLVGPGGSGKTRLAVLVAQAMAGRYPDGVWMVEFAGVRNGASVAEELAGETQIREVPGASIQDSLVSGLEGRRALLLFDNCESATAEIAGLASALLQGCPRITILATSREPLGLYGEETFRLSPLPTPGLDTPSVPSALDGFESVRLFVDRAADALPQFALTDANAPTVARVCRDLHGMPLALEIAAARVAGMPIEDLADSLDSRRQAPDEAPEDTLRGLIRWSYDLLLPSERAVLRAAAAFSGGWVREAVAGVASALDPSLDEEQAEGLLASLVRKSLVIRDEQTRRYRLLETVRHFAWERAAERGERERLRSAHAGWFARWVRGKGPALLGPRQIETADLLEVDHDNLRAAHELFMESENAEAAQRLVVDLAPFWEYRGFLTEGTERGVRALELGPSEARLEALVGTGRLLFLNASGKARDVYEEALRLARGRDLRSEADAEHGLGNLAFFAMELAEAETRFQEAYAIRQEIDDPYGIATSLHSLGNVRLRDGRHAEAEALFERAVAIREELGDLRGVTLTTGALSQLAYSRGDYEAAERLTHVVVHGVSALRIRWALALSLSTLLQIAQRRGDLRRAATLAGTRDRVRELAGFPLPEVERPAHAAALAELREACGPDVYDAAYAEGYAKDWGGAISLALAS